MAYIFNTNLDTKKKAYLALTKIYGVGKSIALSTCNKSGIPASTRLSQLTPSQIDKLANLLNENRFLNIELKHQKRRNLRRLVKIGCYRGFRHTQGLPCRGQRTHGNAKTVRKLKTKIIL